MSDDKDYYSKLLEKSKTIIKGSYNNSLVSNIVLLNLFFLLCRPQYSIVPISVIGLPIILNLILLATSFHNYIKIFNESPIIKAMLTFLLLGIIWIPLARNNFWAFQTTRDLLIQFFCFFFPILTHIKDGKKIKALVNLLLFSSSYLGIYAILHGGKGPGGYLGDENDICMQIDGLIGFSILMLLNSNTFKHKIICSGTTLLCLVGIIATQSRGGFVGMAVVLAYAFLKSSKKILAISLSIILILLGSIFVPQSYWKEMQTITNTKESTAQSRIQFWTVATRMWLDPKNFLFGVGVQNTPRHLADYEPLFNKSIYGKSMSGRSVHSSYFQLVGDLGLAGLILILFLFNKTFKNNRANVRFLQTMKNDIDISLTKIAKLKLGKDINELGIYNSVENTFSMIKKEINYLLSVISGHYASLFGAIAAGAFLSALYYPVFWLLFTFGILLDQYILKLRENTNELISYCNINIIEQV